MSQLPASPPARLHPATQLAAALLHAHDSEAEASFTEPRAIDRRTSHPDGIERHAGTYAVLMAPTLTLLVDDGQEDRPCALSPERICAVWITDSVLRAFGTTYEALRDGSARLENGTIPSPVFDRRSR